MELDLDDLLDRVNLIHRRIARKEREQKAREQQKPMSADGRRHKYDSDPHRNQKHQSSPVASAEPHSPHHNQQQLSERPEQERQPTEVSSRRYIQARSEIFVHTQATWEEERVREYSLPREASRSSVIQTHAGASEDPPPSYSDVAQQTQEAEPNETSRPVVKKEKGKQIRAKKYEGAVRFLAGRKRPGPL